MAAWHLQHEELGRKGIGSRKLYFVFLDLTKTI
jgi:hypothetical protein